jgi:hypothetical protein
MQTSEEFGNVKLGHVTRMWKRNAYWVLFEDLKGRLLGRPTGRAEDIKIKLDEYYYRAQQFNAVVVRTVLALQGPYNGRRQRCHAMKGDWGTGGKSFTHS